MLTDYRPSVDQLLADTSVKYRPTIDEVSAKCRRNVGERKAISAETHLEQLSTVSQPSVDRLSTDYRPLYRPISRSTLPTVNKIRKNNRVTQSSFATSFIPFHQFLLDHFLPSSVSSASRIATSLST